MVKNPLIIESTGRADAAEKGQAGYDNPRENIDPHIKTQVLNTKEIIQNGNSYDLSTFAISGAHLHNDYYLQLSGANANQTINVNSQNLLTSGFIAIGTTISDDKLNIYYAPVNDAAAYGINLLYMPNSTATGSYAYRGMSFTANPFVSAGTTNTSEIHAVFASNLTGDGFDGSLGALYGIEDRYGLFTDSTGTITSVYGLRMMPYIRAGTATNFYNIYIDAPSIGGTITNPAYSIYDLSTYPWYMTGDFETIGNISGAGITACGNVAENISGATIQAQSLISSSPAINLIVPNVTNAPWLRLTTVGVNVGEITNDGGFNFKAYLGLANKFVTVNGNFLVYNQAAELFRINSSGNIGLGFAAPYDRMHISGGALVISNKLAPAITMSGAGAIFVSGGALHFKGSSGTITKIANA